MIRSAHPTELQTLVAIDDDASTLYAEAGLELTLDHSHPFVIAESQRWAEAIRRGLAFVAVDPEDQPIGFVTLGYADDEPYLDQIAVYRKHMNKGIGTALLNHAIAWARDNPLWLTTYSHLPWNAPCYHKHGFIEVAEFECGPDIRGILKEQRAVLPDPDNRIAMVRQPDACSILETVKKV